MKKLLFAAALGFTSFIANAQSGKINIIKGQKFQAVTATKIDMTIEAQGQVMEIPTTVNTTTYFEVDAVSDAAVVLKSKITKLKTATNMMGRDIGADSENKEDLEKEENKPAFTTLNKEVFIDYNTKTGESVTRKDPKATEDAAAGMAAMTGGESATFFLALPENAKVGDTWKKTTKDEKATTEKTYTITKIEGDVATVTVTGTMDANFQTTQMGMEMTISQKGTSKGTYVVTISNHVVLSNAINTDLTGTMDMQGMSMPQTIKVVATYTATEVK